MKGKRITTSAVALTCFIALCPMLPVRADTLLGITWGASGGNARLVSFDPGSGSITTEHNLVLPRGGDFTGLTYDPNHKLLYALTQVDNRRYRINPKTLATTLIGTLVIQGERPWMDANALAYSPENNTLYTATFTWDYWSGTNYSVLCSVNVSNGELTPIGGMSGFLTSLSFNSSDGLLYGLIVYGSGAWDSPYPTHVVTINPATAEMTPLFITPYHTMMGLAFKPRSSQFYSWVNSSSHTYGLTDINGGTVTLLGEEHVGAIAAIVYKDFKVRKAVHPQAQGTPRH